MTFLAIGHRRRFLTVEIFKKLQRLEKPRSQIANDYHFWIRRNPINPVRIKTWLLIGPKNIFIKLKKSQNFEKKTSKKILEKTRKGARKCWNGGLWGWKFSLKIWIPNILKSKEKQIETKNRKIFPKKWKWKKSSKFSREEAPNGNSVKLNYN